MTTSKGGNAPSQPSLECCMCGDHGLSSELFKCKACKFRSQHRYCSNLYPKAETYRVCNWCLSQKDDTVEKTQNSCNSPPSSSTHRNNNSSEDDHIMIKNKKKISGNHGGLKGQRGTLQLQFNSPIKKQRSPEKSPLSSARKRVTTGGGGGGGGGVEERLRRTKSEEIANGGITKVFRNKVRRYKLLDEVSSQ
ncbi:uncharacterized protein LOC132274113 [Cornus florida]|uniref:uncharacterized protein LOC132274113 n=1 Tax=Cornus florida TaxID=4283 RepID=UPI0028A268E9|nr:uncharacterized protein LOC132274113 [Cornus florida]